MTEESVEGVNLWIFEIAILIVVIFLYDVIRFHVRLGESLKITNDKNLQRNLHV